MQAMLSLLSCLMLGLLRGSMARTLHMSRSLSQVTPPVYPSPVYPPPVQTCQVDLTIVPAEGKLSETSCMLQAFSGVKSNQPRCPFLLQAISKIQSFSGKTCFAMAEYMPPLFETSFEFFCAGHWDDKILVRSVVTESELGEVVSFANVFATDGAELDILRGKYKLDCGDQITLSSNCNAFVPVELEVCKTKPTEPVEGTCNITIAAISQSGGNINAAICEAFGDAVKTIYNAGFFFECELFADDMILVSSNFNFRALENIGKFIKAATRNSALGDKLFRSAGLKAPGNSALGDKLFRSAGLECSDMVEVTSTCLSGGFVPHCKNGKRRLQQAADEDSDMILIIAQKLN
eukprot:gene10869-16990_t